MTILEVQVSDEVAHRMAKEMQARDEHPWAACVEILIRDRHFNEERLRAIIREEIGAAIGELEVRGII